MSAFPDFLRTVERPEGAALGDRPALVFHHLPKTAGSSFRHLLESLFEPGECCPAEIGDELLDMDEASRRRYRLFAGHYRYEVLEKLFPRDLWLVLLRHPVERVVSNYYNLRDASRYPPAWQARVRQRPETRNFLARVQRMSLEEYLACDEPRALDRIVNRQTRYLVPSTRCAGGFPRWDREILEEARDHLERRFVFVGVQEEYALARQLFCMTFGLAPLVDPERFTANVNQRERRSGGFELSEGVRAKLLEANAMDVELWRTARRLMHDRIRLFRRALMENAYRLEQELEAWGDDVEPRRPRRRIGAVARRVLGQGLRRLLGERAQAP